MDCAPVIGRKKNKSYLPLFNFLIYTYTMVRPCSACFLVSFITFLAPAESNPEVGSKLMG